MAGADYFTPFPLSLPDDPAVWRLKTSMGLEAACVYYETRAMCAQAYNNHRSVTVEELPGIAWKNHLEVERVTAMFAEMARCGLIDATMWSEGVVQMPDVIERQVYLMTKAENGKKGGRPRKGETIDET